MHGAWLFDLVLALLSTGLGAVALRQRTVELRRARCERLDSRVSGNPVSEDGGWR